MKAIKVRLEIENKEEIENWVHGLVEQLHEASANVVKVKKLQDIKGAEPARRFIPLKDSAIEVFEKLNEKKGLTREDLILIFQNWDINESVFPEIAKARQAAQKKYANSITRG